LCFVKTLPFPFEPESLEIISMICCPSDNSIGEYSYGIV